MKANEKLYLKVRKKSKTYILRNVKSKNKRELLKKHFKRYKNISDKKLREYLNVKRTYKQIILEEKNKEFYNKYKIKKYQRGFFEGKFSKTKNRIYIKYFKFNTNLSKRMQEKIKRGKKLSKSDIKKIEKDIQNNTTMLEKLLLVELTKLKLKGKKITNKLIERIKKRLEKKVEKLKSDLSVNKIHKWSLYEYLY